MQRTCPPHLEASALVAKTPYALNPETYYFGNYSLTLQVPTI